MRILCPERRRSIAVSIQRDENCNAKKLFLLTSGDHRVEIRRICGQANFAHNTTPAYHTLALDAVVLCILGYFLWELCG